MKNNTSFTSLPTGAHRYLVERGDGRFVFKNPEKTDSIEVSEQSVNRMIDRLHVKSGVKNETNIIRANVESSEKQLTPQELRKESDRMRAEVAERAEEKLEQEFVKLDEALGKKLVELYGAQSGKSNPEDVKLWIKSHVTSLPQSGREAFLTNLHTEVELEIKNNSFFEMADNLSGFQKGAKAVNDEVLKIGSASVKERLGNGLGAGLTAMYVAGLFYGAARPQMWYAGLIAGGVSALAPGAAEGVFKASDFVLDTAGNVVNFSFTHLKNALVGVARLDATQMWDGTTDINDRRDELLEKFQSLNAPRPELTMSVQNENGEWVDREMIDETMHQRFQSIPLEKITAENRLKPEQCDQAAQFCVEVFDPSIILTDKNTTPEQKAKLMKLTRGPQVKFDELDEETRNLISRTFASREAVQAWNYFMIHSSDGELHDFTNAFADRWEMKKVQQRAKLPEQIEKEMKEKIESLYPEIDAELLKRTPEGMASFMSEGGLEDILVMIGLLMGGVYAVLFASKGFQKLRNVKKEQLTFWKKTRAKLEKKKKEARAKLSKVMNKNADDMKKKDWGIICGSLLGMGVIHATDKKGLEDLSSTQWQKIVLNMKNNNFLAGDFGMSFGEVQTAQNAFWSCVNKSEMKARKVLPMGSVDSKESATQVEKRKKSVQYFESFVKMAAKYETFRSTRQKVKALPLLKSKDVDGKALKEFWKSYPVGIQKNLWSDIMKDFVGKQTKIYTHMETLGVHENEIKLYKSIADSNGERKTVLSDQIKELLKMYPAGKDIKK
jgi:hypothetical protein